MKRARNILACGVIIAGGVYVASKIFTSDSLWVVGAVLFFVALRLFWDGVVMNVARYFPGGSKKTQTEQ